MSMTKQLKGFRTFYDLQRGDILMNVCFIFMTAGRLFTLNLGWRDPGTESVSSGGRKAGLFEALDWLKRTRAEEMRWKFVGDRRFKVSCRQLPSSHHSLLGLFYENFNMVEEPREGNWGFSNPEGVTNVLSSQIAIHPNKVISALLSSPPLYFSDLFNLIVWGWIQF